MTVECEIVLLRFASVRSVVVVVVLPTRVRKRSFHGKHPHACRRSPHARCCCCLAWTCERCLSGMCARACMRHDHAGNVLRTHLRVLICGRALGRAHSIRESHNLERAHACTQPRRRRDSFLCLLCLRLFFSSLCCCLAEHSQTAVRRCCMLGMCACIMRNVVWCALRVLFA